MKKPELPREFWQMLADVKPHGLELTPEIVESWFDLKWPEYQTRGYKKHRRAIASWWARVWESEIELAIERLDKLNERTSIERLESRLPPPPDLESIPDFLKVVANK